MSYNEKPWIGVDFDGTLSVYTSKQWPEIGPPIMPMVERVRRWLGEGKRVKIMTARAADAEQVELVRRWTEQFFGEALEVTDRKDYAMVELWDDRAVGVVKNKGTRVDGRE